MHDICLKIDKSWDGRALPEQHRATVAFVLSSKELRVAIDAPYYGDAAPSSPPGSTDRLWEFEVVELFLAGPEESYLELEFGPLGHYLALECEGIRNAVRTGQRLDFNAKRVGGRFIGVAVVSRELVALPNGPLRANAYLIHNAPCVPGTGRCYHAHSPVPGHRPDFHRLDCFVSVSEPQAVIDCLLYFGYPWKPST